MKFTRHFPNLFTRRRVQSLFCLVAALLLQSPVLAAAAIASGACCTSDHCPIAAHHHAAAKAEAGPMDCDHNMNHSGDKVQSCSMSCCNTTEQSAGRSDVFFLLSPVIELASVNPLPETISGFDASETAAAFAPPSPPPKLLRLI